MQPPPSRQEEQPAAGAGPAAVAPWLGMSYWTKAASVGEQSPPLLPVPTALPWHWTQLVWPAVVQGRRTTGVQQKFPAESFTPWFASGAGHVPADVSGVASVPAVPAVGMPKQGMAAQQKLPAESLRLLLWPAGQVPAALFGVASVLVPTPAQAGDPQVTVTLATPSVPHVAPV